MAEEQTQDNDIGSQTRDVFKDISSFDKYKGEIAEYISEQLVKTDKFHKNYLGALQNKANLKSILQKYGIEPKEIKKLRLP